MIGPVHLDGSTTFRLTPFDQVVDALRNGVPPRISGRFNGQVYELAAGTVVATLDGAALTARRAPAVSALATDDLARPDATRLAVFGTGVQAREHIRAMRWIRPSIDEIDVVGRDVVSTDRFVAMLRGEGFVVRAADRAGECGAGRSVGALAPCRPPCEGVDQSARAPAPRRGARHREDLAGTGTDGGLPGRGRGER